MSVLFHSPAGGSAQRVQAGQVLELTAPVLADGVTVFRRTLYLRIALDGACDRVTLDTAALALRFEPCTVQVSRGNDDWVRRWQGSVGTLDVELSYPAPITRVDSALYATVALHRVDGEAVSDDATATGATGAALPEPFSAAAFQARLTGEKPGLRVAEKHKVIAQKHAAHKTLSAAAVGVQMLDQSQLAMQHADRIVELVNGLSTLHLAGTPGSPRLTLRSADGSEVLWQWIQAGQQAGAVDFAPATLAQDVQPALERALALADEAAKTSGTPRPAALVLPLDLASDSPCRVRVQQADVTALLERPLLAASITLRFSGVAREQQLLALGPQAGARKLELVGHFSHDVGASAPGAAPEPVGVFLTAGSSVLLTVPITRPLRCAGVAFGWHPLGARTVLTLRLDRPGDAAFAPVTVRVETMRTDAGTLYARWPAVDLQGGLHALRVAVDEGSGVFVATPDATAAPMVVTDDAGSRGLRLAPDLALLDADAAGQFPVDIALNGTALAATAEPGDSLRALLDPVPTTLAQAAEWTLQASSAVPLVLQIETARVGYTPA